MKWTTNPRLLHSIQSDFVLQSDVALSMFILYMYNYFSHNYIYMYSTSLTDGDEAFHVGWSLVAKPPLAVIDFFELGTDQLAFWLGEVLFFRNSLKLDFFRQSESIYLL